MSVRPDPVIPDTRRRRASTTEKSERILTMSRSLTLTRGVLANMLAEATPNQLDLIERWFTAELDSREQSKRVRLLKQAGFPADKTLDGYDWTNLNMPADWGASPIGEPRVHQPMRGPRALRARRGRQKPPRHRDRQTRLRQGHTGPVLHRDRPAHAPAPRTTGQPARQGTRGHRQSTPPDHRRVRLPAHRRGRQPPPLPDHQRQLRDKEHHPLPPTSNPADGDAFSATRTWPPHSSTAPSTTDDSSDSKAAPTAANTPS